MVAVVVGVAAVVAVVVGVGVVVAVVVAVGVVVAVAVGYLNGGSDATETTNAAHRS